MLKVWWIVQVGRPNTTNSQAWHDAHDRLLLLVLYQLASLFGLGACIVISYSIHITKRMLLLLCLVSVFGFHVEKP